MSDLTYLSASELTAEVRNGRVSAVEVVKAHLERISQLNPVLNAFVAVRYEEALEEARKLDDSLDRGATFGPLSGVPVAIKDVEDVAGLATTYGSLPFRDNVAREDSVHVSRLRRAGAIILGKTNTPEFAYAGFTKNLIFGVTRSPWNLDLTPGGSSGGSAAAVAAGMAALATGTDRGGSIRIPASYTGCFGFKPSFGRIARGPQEMLNWSDTEVLGPLSRTVKDAALYLDAAAGPHWCDPDSLPAPGYRFSDVVDRTPSGLKACWTPTMGYARADGQVRRKCVEAAMRLEGAGWEVEEDESLKAPDMAPHWGTIAGPERYAQLAHLIPKHREEFGRAFLARVEAGGKVTAVEYGVAQKARAELNRILGRAFERFDLLLTPATATTAFDARGRLPETIDGVPVSNPLEVTPFTYPFNLSGHPAACVRAGLTDDGMPVGLQIVGPRLRDDLVLQVARAFEQLSPWNDSWPAVEGVDNRL